MMHNTLRTCVVVALLGLAACSPKMALDEGAAPAPVVEAPATVIMEEPTPLERKTGCGTTSIDDGIGGTGCPAPID